MYECALYFSSLVLHYQLPTPTPPTPASRDKSCVHFWQIHGLSIALGHFLVLGAGIMGPQGGRGLPLAQNPSRRPCLHHSMGPVHRRGETVARLHGTGQPIGHTAEIGFKRRPMGFHGTKQGLKFALQGLLLVPLPAHLGVGQQHQVAPHLYRQGHKNGDFQPSRHHRACKTCGSQQQQTTRRHSQATKGKSKKKQEVTTSSSNNNNNNNNSNRSRSSSATTMLLVDLPS